MRALRALQTALQRAGLRRRRQLLSITEVSEYAKGMPEHMLQARLYPQLPPEGKPVFCFYPMSKRREAHANWFATPYEERNAHDDRARHERPQVRRPGRAAVTGSTGLDDYEWGVTLFATTLDVVKDVVYTMRFDQASALYGEFGAFYVGYLAYIDERRLNRSTCVPRAAPGTASRRST